MTASESVVKLVERHRLVGIIRLADLSDAVEISKALLRAGVVLQEFTLSNPAALDALVEVRNKVAEFDGVQAALGVGSVRSLDEAKRAIDAGAQFVVTPIMLAPVISHCVKEGVPIMPGAFTPTEIATAWDAGASVVKVFPARSLGPSYIRDVLAPMPYLKLMPTGGVDAENMSAYFAAGAVAVGVGGNIIDSSSVTKKDWPSVTAVAAKYVERARRSDGGQ